MPENFFCLVGGSVLKVKALLSNALSGFAVVLFAIMAMLPTKAHAGFDEEITETARLSTWLAARIAKPDAGANPYLVGLVWSVPDERFIQARAKSDLLVRMQDFSLSPDVTSETALSLAGFVDSLPATGRVVLDGVDPRWLEIHPEKDPLLKRGQRLILRDRPETITVVFGNGGICHAKHDISLFASDYIRQCDNAASPHMAWLVQPDGVVQRRGVALWNLESQDPPAPGAWIVVGDSRYPWHEVVYDQLARLLATQGPSLPKNVAAIQPVRKNEHGMLDGLWRSSAPTDLRVTAGDRGSVGLLQTPTARMAAAGEGSLSISQTEPYTHLNFNLQPFDWLETSFRYTDISNRAYEASSTGQAYKDKSIDIKLRLTQESAFVPQIAVGVRDLTGTGLFSGEYFVANKRTGNLDWSLGVGWGYLGARGDYENPLSFLGDSLKTRPKVTESAGTGGEVNLSSFFHGPVALFGGVQYQTAWDDLILKLEYEGNDYRHEPQNNNQRQTTPINVGAVWRYSDNLDLNLGWERGTKLMLGANFHGRLDRLLVAKVNDPKLVAVSPQYPKSDSDWQKLATALESTTGWRVQQLRRAGSELIVKFDKVEAFYWNDYIDRIAAILHRDVSGKVLVFRIQSVNSGLNVDEYLIDRRVWVEAKTRYQPPHEKQSSIVATSYADGFINPYDETLLDVPVRLFNGDYGIYYQQSLGGADGFILYQLGGKLTGTWQPRADTWLTGVLHARVLDNYDSFVYEPPPTPALERVRTHIREYLTTSEVTLPLLQMTHVGKIDVDQYYSVYGGMLESMYGGVGAEWMYRPFGSRMALGIDVNAVRQRGFEQNFSFRDYKTATGHVSLYWDTGFQEIQATFQAGRYLAGDVGITVDLARVFPNGVKMGAWFTKTDVSAEEFGEGSFDKGIYVDIPFDAIMTRSSGSVASLVWQPLTRDGGARLGRSVRLDDLTRGARGNSLDWLPFSAARKTQFGDVGDYENDPLRKVSMVDAAQEDLSILGNGLDKFDFWKSIVLAGGVTALSAVLDKPIDTLAQDYGNTTSMKAVEAVGNFLPLAVMGFSGFMAIRDRDPRMAKASFASLEAGGVGLAAALGLKYALGRSRPEAGQGAGKFNFLSSDNGDSSLPSIHSTVAWAAITPYAKAYHAPWLYGLAALTNVARIGERKHWFSDTVGGAILGYGLGSLFWENRKQSKDAPSLYVSSGEIGLEWHTP